MTHPATHHGCEPIALRFTADGVTHLQAAVTFDGTIAPDVERVALICEVGQWTRVEITFTDGVVDTYEAEEATVDVTGWPVCPTDEHGPQESVA